ncbi:hypothetical protein ALC56_03143 [Trachymyrmex septentrionalis]|uniref:Uncharacterized protein n=1 Tax=Trachymyrmex septentrionalis TaxID=34720 RepID=A0A151JZX3_9HYME|nr:hypothetical protein ALC56_03143 [Trachymyrmex septentrionalis]
MNIQKVRIVSRKITKFVTRRTIENSVNLQNTVDDFLKIHSGRSLSNQGIKKVECVQSISSTHHSLFTPINVIVKASGKMTSEETYFLNIGSNSVLFIESWTGHCPNIISDLLKDFVLLLESNINLHERSNIIKLKSLIQSINRHFRDNLFKYLWFKSGCTNE